MKKYRGIIAELCGNKEKFITKFIEGLTLSAYADEEDDGDDGGEDDEDEGEDDDEDGDSKKRRKSTVSFEDLISKARKEEKNKHQKTIAKLKEQIATLTKQHNSDLLSVAELEKTIKELEGKLTSAGKGDSEEVKGLKETITTLQGEKKTLEGKVKEYESNQPPSREDIEKEVREELEAEYEVRAYKAEKLAELKDSILVPELVGGSTKEEIDSSIEAAVKRSDEIRKNLGIEDGGTPPKKNVKKRTPKTPNPSIESIQGKKIDLDYLASLDPGSKEYAEVRKQLGLK